MKKILIAIAAVLFTSSVSALPSTAFEKVYYSDSSKQRIVGHMAYMCGRTTYYSGEKTNYFEETVFKDCSNLLEVPHHCFNLPTENISRCLVEFFAIENQ